MTSYNVAQYNISKSMTLEGITATAHLVRQDGIKIAAGGIAAAREYVEAFCDKHQFNWKQDRRDATAKSALYCAQAIAGQDAATWVAKSDAGHAFLCVPVLTPDGTAGHLGFLPMLDVKTNAVGRVTHYAKHDLNGAVWIAAE